jgi:hypothetical protein
VIVLLTHWVSYDRLISQRVLHWQLKLPSCCGDSFSVQADVTLVTYSAVDHSCKQLPFTRTLSETKN